jgi:hypothetical protein
MADDEFAGQMPRLAERIVDPRGRSDRLVIAPIGDDMNSRRDSAELFNVAGH